MTKRVVPLSQIMEDAESRGISAKNLRANPRDIVAIDDDQIDDDELDDDLEENPECE